MECGSSLTACSAHGSTPGQFFCPGAKHSFCCKEHCCYLTSFDGRIIAQKSDFVNRYYRKRGKKQEMGNGKLAQGCQSGVVGGRRPRRPMGHCRFAQAIVKMGNAEVWGVAALSERPAQGNSTAGGRWCTTEPPDVSLRGGRRPTWRPEREARGSALGVQSRSTQPDNRVLPANTAALRDGASRTPPPTRRVRSAGIPGNLQLPKALTERRYRRNRLVRFYRHLVRTGSAFPRLPRRPAASSQ